MVPWIGSCNLTNVFSIRSLYGIAATCDGRAVVANCAIVVLYETSLVSSITTPRISIRPMRGRRRETKHYAHAIFKEEGGDLMMVKLENSGMILVEEIPSQEKTLSWIL